MSNRDPQNPRVVLEENHRHIRALLDRLVACVRADDREAAKDSWGQAERALLKHLDVEEMFVFPALVQAHAKEIETLVREHAVLRRELGVIGLALDLHTVRAEAVDAFCAVLREHAEREESLVYAPAERTLPVNVVRAIVERLVRPTSRKRGSRARSPAPGIAS